MTQKTRPILKSATAFLLAFIMLLSLLPFHASAAGGRTFEGNVELTGAFKGGQFTLDTSDTELFSLKNIVPGDRWVGQIHVANETGSRMEVSILHILNNLEDTILFDALDLEVSVNGKIYYDGSYGDTEKPITPWHSLYPDTSLTYDVVIELPRTVGNEAQGKIMDSTWVFEARNYGSGNEDGDDPENQEYNYKVLYQDEDGNQLLPTKWGSAPYGDEVTEYAPDINGYIPDAEEKSITIQKSLKENIIIFVYCVEGDDSEQPKDPVDPDVPPVDPDEPTTPDQPTDPNQPTDPGQPSEPGTPTNPEIPDNPPKPGDDKIQTGVDMTRSNTSISPWFWAGIFSTLTAGILLMRVNQAKKRADENNDDKEGTSHGK